MLMGILVVRSHPKLFSRFLTQLEVAVAKPEHQTTSILFIFGLLQNW
jgi:hypothetical protein